MIKDIILDAAAFGLFVAAVYIYCFITPTTTTTTQGDNNGYQEHTYQPKQRPITKR